MWSDEKPFFSLLKQNTHIPSRSTKWIYLALYVFVDHCWTLDCIKCNQIEPGKCVCVSRARVYYWAHPTSTWMAAFRGLLWCLLKKAAMCDPLASCKPVTDSWMMLHKKFLTDVASKNAASATFVSKEWSCCSHGSLWIDYRDGIYGGLSSRGMVSLQQAQNPTCISSLVWST